MKSGEVTDVIFAVDVLKRGHVVSVHPDIIQDLKENIGVAEMDDGGFKNYPDKPGIYKAKCKFEVKGYGEDVDYWYILSDVQEISCT